VSVVHVLAALEQLLLPNACVACDRLCEPSNPHALVCPGCRARLTPLTGGCPRCHQPLPLIGGCRFCRPWPPELRWVRSGVWLGAEAREIVHHLKYDGYTPLAAFMAHVVTRAAPAPPAGVLVPIPLTPSRLKHRGFNQAALLAGALGTTWRLPVRERLLTRRRESGSQTALTPEERLANVTGAFAAPADGAVEGPVVIVDDVLTTGATLSAAATALASAGWRDLGAITFARALPYERRVV
jgi:predicted amidophosphoribosyltransferase